MVKAIPKLRIGLFLSLLPLAFSSVFCRSSTYSHSVVSSYYFIPPYYHQV